jgi:predicted metal-dependent peptidase
MDAVTLKLKKAHMALMKHPETCLYGGVMMMGNSEVSDDIPTACTDGINKYYGREFMDKLTPEETRGIVLHETLHVALRHLPRHRAMCKENAMLANMAMDFVVNDVIMNIKDKKLCKLPEGALYMPGWSGWSVRQIYDELKKVLPPPPPPPPGKKPCKNPPNGQGGQDENEGQGGTPGKPGDSGSRKGEKVIINGKEMKPFDDHDMSKVDELSSDEHKVIEKDIKEALQQGGMLAGRFGVKMPRTISELLTPKVNWRDALRDFVSAACRGRDEFTWRKMNRRRLADDHYVPSMEDETVDEIVVAIDTSGSIGGRELTEFATELASICDTMTPSCVRVLWWDTHVHGEQVFRDEYTNIAKLLKPLGGGGTKVSCVSEYMIKNNISCEALIVFTDGYVESNINWKATVPTLWMITQNEGFTPPVGNVVKVDKDA